MTGQISLTDYLQDRDNVIFRHCGQCVCRVCLYWWSSRCPYGECWDDHRAETEPYDKAHLDRPTRTGWSDWNKPGEQAHWCRGGVFYPVHYCPEFIKYKGQQIKYCIKEAVQVFQDGYIHCSLVDTVGCQACYEELMDKEERYE